MVSQVLAKLVTGFNMQALLDHCRLVLQPLLLCAEHTCVVTRLRSQLGS